MLLKSESVKPELLTTGSGTAVESLERPAFPAQRKHSSYRGESRWYEEMYAILKPSPSMKCYHQACTVGNLDYAKRMKRQKVDDFVTPNYPIAEIYCRRKEKQCQLCFSSYYDFALQDIDEGSQCFKLPVVAVEGKGCRLWTELEEVFLVGLVFDALYKRGSLAPSKHERQEKDKCWQKLKQKYDVAVSRYAFLTRSSTSTKECFTRTKLALLRHFKVLKAQVSEDKSDDEEVPFFKKLHLQWDNDYNKQNILCCTDEKFKVIVTKLRSTSNHKCFY